MCVCVCLHSHFLKEISRQKEIPNQKRCTQALLCSLSTCSSERLFHFVLYPKVEEAGTHSILGLAALGLVNVQVVDYNTDVFFCTFI